jgi:putative transcriptional regulator
MENLQSGTILIADPFLKDPNFLRSVVFLCSYKDDGSFGFLLNKKSEYVMSDLFTDLEGCNLPVFYGGPVQQDTVHFLHRCPGLITGGERIIDDIYWGGEFDEMISLIQNNKITEDEIRLFLGYSGWSKNQLEDELNEKSWLTTYGTSKLVFINDEKLVWAEALKQLGGKYEQLIHYPTDPQLN